jgi:hypothetical protein
VRGTSDLPAEEGLQEAVGILRDAVPGASEAGEPVVLEVAQAPMWPMAAGLLTAMEQSGAPAGAGESWVGVIGSDRGAHGDESWRVTLVPAAEVLEVPFGAEVGVVASGGQDIALVLSRVNG